MAEERARLRSEIIARISLPRTAKSVFGMRELVIPTLEVIACLREEILERVALWRPEPRWHSWGKRIAIVTVLALLVRMTPMFFIATTLRAEAQNLLIPTSGSVSVTDGAEWSEAAGETALDHPLTIRTGIESSATIIIRDEAVLRLGENTELTLRDAAFAPPSDNPIARISYGQVWLTGLLPEPLFAGMAVVLPHGMVAVKDGSVDLLVDPVQSVVRTFSRFPRVLPTGDSPIHLIEGDQLTLLPKGAVQRHLITATMRAEEWVRANRARDAAHRTEVSDRKQQLSQVAAGILPDSAFYFLKIASERIDLGLTLGEKSRREKQLQHAQTRINEAVALLKAGKTEAAEHPLAAYREAIRKFAGISEDEARALLASSLIDSSTTVASALPHSDLYPAKKAVLAVATEVENTEIQMTQVDLYLLSDALLGMESLIAAGDVTKALLTFDGIEGAIASVLNQQELDGTEVTKDGLKAIKAILRSVTMSLQQAEETVPAEHGPKLASLRERFNGFLPAAKPATVAVRSDHPAVCMTVREVTRRINSFLASVYTYQTPRGQRNEVLRQISTLPRCQQSAAVLSKVMNKVPVFTRSFVWEALQKIETTL